jgi:hypothetical protein
LGLTHPYGSGWGCFLDYYGARGQATYGDWGGSVTLLLGSVSFTLLMEIWEILMNQ